MFRSLQLLNNSSPMFCSIRLYHIGERVAIVFQLFAPIDTIIFWFNLYCMYLSLFLSLSNWEFGLKSRIKSLGYRQPACQIANGVPSSFPDISFFEEIFAKRIMMMRPLDCISEIKIKEWEMQIVLDKRFWHGHFH